MPIRIAIISCASLDAHKITHEGKDYSSGELLAKKIIDYGKTQKIDFEAKIYRPPANPDDFPAEYDAVIIPGSKHDIDDEGRKSNPWMENLIGFIRKNKKPILGICFGHQAIAVAFGAKMAPEKKLELGFLPTELTKEGEKDKIFEGIPKKFDSMQYHFRFIGRPPPEVVVLAYGANHIQAFRIGENTWGVQFHPDYSAQNVGQMIERRKVFLSKSTDLSKVRLEAGKRVDERVLFNFLKAISR